MQMRNQLCLQFDPDPHLIHCPTLVDAVCAGNQDVVADYLVTGGNPDATFSNDCLHGNIHQSMLSIATQHNQLQIVRLLLDHGANPRGTDVFSESPLWWAARNGNLEITKELVSHGSALGRKLTAFSARSALHEAIFCNHPEIVRYLIDSGVDVKKGNVNDSRFGSPTAHRSNSPRSLTTECERELTRK